MPISRDALDAMTAEDLYALAVQNPSVRDAIVKDDPRVRLMEALYKDPEHKKQIERMGVAVAPDSTIARAQAGAREAIADDVLAIKNLRADLEKDRTTQARTSFRDALRDHAKDTGLPVTDEALDKIEQFMVDNEFGPKAVAAAVAAYAEGAAPGEPNFEDERGFTFGDEGSKDADYLKALTNAAPGADTSLLSAAHHERVYRDMFGAKDSSRRRPPTFA